MPSRVMLAMVLALACAPSEGAPRLDAVRARDERTAEALIERHKPYHEAAHAVVAIALGVRVHYVTLNDFEASMDVGEPVAGGTFHELPSDPTDVAVIAAAGLVVTRELARFGESLAGPLCAIDVRRIQEWAGPDIADRKRAVHRARQIVRKYRGSIQAVGQALHEHRRLTGNEIAMIVERTRAVQGRSLR